jgi:indolepyruvate ferredoxin oxidoreductase
VLRLLAALRKLRGTPLDVFGYTAERRMERRLIAEFEATIDTVIANLRADNIAAATTVLCHYLDIRGYGPVKEEAAAEVRARVAEDLHALMAGPQRSAA